MSSEKVLVLECLGPPESEWNQQSFQVNRFGCIGGRKHNAEDNFQSKEIVLFKDITVSRRHFEVGLCGVCLCSNIISCRSLNNKMPMSRITIFATWEVLEVPLCV